MRSLRLHAALAAAFVPLLLTACPKKGAVAPHNPDGTIVGTAPPPPPPCKEAQPSPGDILAKEPGIVTACITNAGKVNTNLCGSAKIALKLGRDGKVQNAEVAQSTLPIPVTDCIKARLAAITFACPSSDSAVYSIPVGLPGGGPNGECPGMPAGAPPPPK